MSILGALTMAFNESQSSSEQHAAVSFIQKYIPHPQDCNIRSSIQTFVSSIWHFCFWMHSRKKAGCLECHFLSFQLHRITILLQIMHFGPTSTMYFTNPAEWEAHISNPCCNLLEVRTLLHNNIDLPISDALYTRA